MSDSNHIEVIIIGGGIAGIGVFFADFYFGTRLSGLLNSICDAFANRYSFQIK